MTVPYPELHRQVRALLALLRALIRRSAGGRESIEDYAAHLEARLDVLARAQEILTRDPAVGVDFDELVHDEFRAQGVEPSDYRAAGPDIRLSGHAAGPLALAVHELILNSFVHGALADEGGRASIEWKVRRRAGNDWLCIRWRESGGAAPLSRPLHKGFGMQLMEHMLPHELDARTVFGFPPSGARMLMMIPRFTVGRTSTWAPDSGLQLLGSGPARG